MKTKLFILTICIAMLSVGATAKTKDGKVLKGASLTQFGDYSIIESTTPMVIGNKTIKTFDLEYEILITWFV